MQAIIELAGQVKELWRQLREMQRNAATRHYRGVSAIDFTTTTLPHLGDYGFQSTDAELQMNCNGVIRATAMAAV